MNKYYLTLVLKSDLEEKDRKEILDSLKKNLDSVEKEDLWGSRDLSYPIKHQTKGWYAHFEFSSDPQKIAGLDKNLKLDENVLRYLLLRKDK